MFRLFYTRKYKVLETLHPSTENVRRSILVRSDIYRYSLNKSEFWCILVSTCPSVRLFGPKLTSELRPFFTSYLGHIVLAFTNALLYVTGISFLQNHFVSLTLRPGGAYVFRPDTFLVLHAFTYTLTGNQNDLLGNQFSKLMWNSELYIDDDLLHCLDNDSKQNYSYIYIYITYPKYSRLTSYITVQTLSQRHDNLITYLNAHFDK